MTIDRLKIQNKKFDIIFMDPPYYKNMFIDALSSIDEADLLCDDGIIVVEHDTKDKFVDKIGRLEKTRDKKYGNTTWHFISWRNKMKVKKKSYICRKFWSYSNGHLDIICRASKLFDELQIGVLITQIKRFI